AGPERPDRRSCGAHDCDAGRICRVAGHAGDRRFRPAHVRSARLSRRGGPGPAPGDERLCRLERRTPMTVAPRPDMRAVAAREVAWIRRDRVARLLVFVLPLVAFALLAATFSSAVVRELRVDIIDQDRSRTSQTVVQAVNSAPSTLVAHRSGDLAE